MAFLFVIVVVSFIVGLAKGGIGGVLGVAIVPMLTLVMPVQQAISLSLPLLMVGDWFSVWAYWKRWDMRYVKYMFPLAVIGVVIGTYLLKVLPDATLRPVLGVFTLLFVVYQLVSARIRELNYRPRFWHNHFTGAVTGLSSALANNGSVPFTAYMLLQDIDPTVFVATGTLFFALLNLVKLPGLIFAGLFNLNDFLGVIWVLPLIPIGVWVSRWLIVRMNKASFDRFMLLVLFITAIYLFIPPSK